MTAEGGPSSRARWLLLRNRDSLRPGEDIALDELQAANHSLFVVYIRRDALKNLRTQRRPALAVRAWKIWYRKALRSGIAPLRHFATKLRMKLIRVLGRSTAWVSSRAQCRTVGILKMQPPFRS
ncbi:MAG: transposase [Proteobacteria bacterium]|nr:transposase [Pseudomonadota bacterium]